MTLRKALGRDAHRVHELVDQLLDAKDAVIVLVDGRRALSYAEGFGLSACQLELLTIEMERAVRVVAGRGSTDGSEGRTRREKTDDSGSSARIRQHPGRHGLQVLRRHG